MSADGRLSRRAFAGGLALLGLSSQAARPQGFAGLGGSADGFAPVIPGRPFSFPADHGPHPDFRIEWWYVTANLVDTQGAAYGAQWTLFRQAMRPDANEGGWSSGQIWMAHAAATRADTHRTAETFARGGVGQAGVEINPFQAWIDAWAMRSAEPFEAETISRLDLSAAGKDFSYALHLQADHALVLQGNAGYSRKSQHEQASYYYSQPFFKVAGQLTFGDAPVEVTGQAWMDREWSSQPLAADQTGWDWFALHLTSGEKLMLYRMRQSNGRDYISGSWILPDASKRQLGPEDVQLTPGGTVEIAGHRLPVQWHIAIPSLQLAIDCEPLNPKAWMGTIFAYWEGPIRFHGSHTGVGYLELTGY